MIIGIDLGTTNSLVGIWKDGQAELISNALGSVLTPSVVSVDEDGSILVGQSAKERLISHPNVTASVFKRFMGNDKKFHLGKTHTFSAIELSSLVLKSLKADAESYLNESIVDAVITVPAYFNEHQRQATKNAAEIAGLNVRRLVNEPTAAAMSYGLHENLDDGKFLVLDLGGGTFDVTILELFSGIMEVHASAGDNALGGEDFTQVLFDGFIKQQNQQHNTSDEFWLPYEPLLYAEAEKAKKMLTSKNKAMMSLSVEEVNYEYQVSEKEFDILCTTLWERFRSPIEKALRDSNNKTKELDNIVLVGGATRMHVLRSRMTRLLGRFPAINLNPDETIANGACIQAGLIAEDKALDEVIMTDVAPFSLGVSATLKIEKNKYKYGIFCPIIERNTIIPTSKVHSFSPIDDRQTEVSFHIYQGEARLAEDNIKLGETTVNIPKKYYGKATQVDLDVRFSYDVNGLLEVDIDMPDSEKTVNLVIQNGASQLTETEMQASKKKLERLKIHPRDQAENRSLLARAERLYTQRLGSERESLLHIISWFESMLDTQDIDEIKKAKKIMKENLSVFEKDDIF